MDLIDNGGGGRSRICPKHLGGVMKVTAQIRDGADDPLLIDNGRTFAISSSVWGGGWKTKHCLRTLASWIQSRTLFCSVSPA